MGVFGYFPDLMSDFITFFASTRSIYKACGDYLSIFYNNAAASSAVTGSFFSDYAANIHKIFVFCDVFRIKVTVVFDTSVLIHYCFLCD